MREYDNIVLIGMPGVGKSTAGVIAAKTLGLKFEDTDLMIQTDEHRLLKQIISDEGVEGFLKIEENVLKNIDQKGYLIATGGSAVYGAAGMDHLRENSLIIYLHLELEELTHRLGNLQNRGVVLKPGQTLADIYEERLPLYRRFADIEIDETGLDLEATVAKICSGAYKYNYSQNTGLTNS